MSTPYIALGWEALRDLRAMPWSDHVELGAGLLGHRDRRGIVRVERAVANPCGAPCGPDWTSYDARHLIYAQKLSIVPGEQELTLVGLVHSHPSGSTRASERDLVGWRLGARGFGRFAGLIVTSGDGGDWADRTLSGWIAEPTGAVRRGAGHRGRRAHLALRGAPAISTGGKDRAA